MKNVVARMSDAVKISVEMKIIVKHEKARTRLAKWPCSHVVRNYTKAPH
jgi:hypothetical protein